MRGANTTSVLCFFTKLLAVIGQAEGVISGRGRDDPFPLLLVVEHDERVASAALLEAAGVLHVVLLQVDVHPGLLRQMGPLRNFRNV